MWLLCECMSEGFNLIFNEAEALELHRFYTRKQSVMYTYEFNYCIFHKHDE